MDGDIDKAFKFLGSYFPHVLDKEENRDIYFRLRCRKYIEMLRRCTEMQSASDDLAVKPAPGLSAGNGQPDSIVPHDGHSPVFDDQQMELDEQLQRETIPPTDTLHSDGGVMDTGPDSHPIKSAAISHTDLLNAALRYGIELNAEFSSDHRPMVKKALGDTLALIAYTDARDSVLADLIEGKGRVEIAEQVNGAILGESSATLRPIPGT